MAPFHEVERSFTGAKIRETRHTRGRRVFPGKPTVVEFLGDNTLRIRENDRERLIEVTSGNPEPLQLIKSGGKTKVRKGPTVFVSQEFGKRIEIEWREK